VINSLLEQEKLLNQNEKTKLLLDLEKKNVNTEVLRKPIYQMKETLNKSLLCKRKEDHANKKTNIFKKRKKRTKKT